MTGVTWTPKFQAEYVTASEDFYSTIILGSTGDAFNLYTYRARWESGLSCAVTFQESSTYGHLVAVQAYLLSPCCGEEYDDFSDFAHISSGRATASCRGCRADLDVNETYIVWVKDPNSFTDYWRDLFLSQDGATRVESWIEALGLADPLSSMLEAWDTVQSLTEMEQDEYRTLGSDDSVEFYSLADLTQKYGR